MTIPICALGALASLTLGAPFPLAREGKPTATVVLSERPTLAARFAAEELVGHVRRISGAELPVATDAQPVEGPRVLVGESAATRALGLASDDFATQERLVRQVDPETLVLMGRDAPTAGGEGMPPSVAGRFGNARAFDGTTGSIVISDPGFTDDAGSMELWVRFSEEVQQSEATLLRLDGANPWTYHIIRRWPGTSAVGYSTYDGSAVHNTSSGELSAGWHHVLATWDTEAGRTELFVDGVSQGTAEFARSTCAGTSLSIGGMAPPAPGAPAGNPFHGEIDEVRLSSVVRAPGDLDAPPEGDGATLLLLRLDESEGPVLDSGPRRHETLPLPGWYEERGSLDAVYDFLERSCGVRWYAPTDLGTAFEPRATLEVEVVELRRQPDMLYRWITPTTLYLPTKADPVPARQADLWRLRMRLGGEAFWVCHSFGGYPERFLAEHPEWFAQGQGERPSQLCYTNEELVRQLARDASDFFESGGARAGESAIGDVFGIVPMDDNRWCQCPECQAALDVDEARNPQFSNGRASRYVWGFVDQVARAVLPSHPDKRVGALAYWEYAYYPEGLELAPNVVVQTCLHTRNWFCPSMEANDRKVFDTWVEREGDKRPIYLWLYYNFPALQSWAEKWNSFPSYFAHTAIEQMAWYRAGHVRGIFLEHSSEFGESHLMDLPDLYLTLRLAEDASLSGEEVFEEFFGRFYGPAAAPMREAYLLIEEAYSNPANYPTEIQTSASHQHQTEALAWGSLGTRERLDRLEALLAQARASVPAGVERERVEWFARGIVEYMLAGRAAWEAKGH